MAAKKSRRFGTRSVEDGQFQGGLHVATESYRKFASELSYFHSYLNRRLLPTEPEEVEMQGILTNLQNLLEHESEELIRHYTQHKGTAQEQKFVQQINEGFVAFKTKCDWLRARSLIGGDEWDVMDEVRRLRNDYVHARPATGRRRFQYRGFPLLTLRNIRMLFVDVELTLRKLREPLGRTPVWMTVPPGYAAEMDWPAKYIEALEGKKHK